jgi:hypothetical protein
MVITLILLREDIAKRDDRLSWAYQYFIDNFSTQPWSRTIDFKRKNKKSKEVIKPEFIRISEKQYNSYVPWAQEYLKNVNFIGVMNITITNVKYQLIV